jgi:predicted DNA-binding transcriptional regulator AlpA
MNAILLTAETVPEFAELIASIVSEKIRAEAKTMASLIAVPDRFLNLGETCQELGISRPTLRKLVQGGHLTPVFNGTRTPRFRLSDIRAVDREGVRRLNRLR